MASLQEILEARERRAEKQTRLLETHGGALVCFTMNIPGPDKGGEPVCRGFQWGLRLLRQALAGYAVSHFEAAQTPAGWEAFLCTDCPGPTLKRLTAGIEDSAPMGRVFDMDVLTPEGKLDRVCLGLPRRKCLLCGREAVQCARSRAHPLEALRQETFRLLESGLCEAVAGRAVASLLCEVYATPKPGLVDQSNRGSHKDMDIFTFLSSAAALWPYFRRCARIGMEGRNLADTFLALRQAGLEAEEAMLRATGGVNTHKGAIFCLGLLCGSAGMLPPEKWGEPEALCGLCAQMAQGLTERELAQGVEPRTAGERIYRAYGIAGARGQAEAGFPGAREQGLPALEAALEKGHSLNDALCQALLHIMAHTCDTNLIHRGGMEAQRWVWEHVEMLLRQEPFPSRQSIEALDRELVLRELSPGGSADLLAAACFLHLLK